MRGALLVLLGVVGCNELECGIGTYEREGQCVPSLLVACGSGTRYERGYCVAADVIDSPDAPSETQSDGDD